MTVQTTRGCRNVRMSAALIYFVAMAATAATQEEEKLSTAPMPHEIFDTSGPQVLVHRVSLRGYLEGNPGNSARLAQLKEQVHNCVAEHQQSGMQTRAPAQWPEFLTSMRDDIYFGVNRSIRYMRAIAYGVNFTDCSLLEVSTSKARIVTTSGVCEVDLVKKTASGACRGESSSGAASRSTGHNATAMNIILQKMAADPRRTRDIVALDRAQASGDNPTGEHRTILGLECEVRSQVVARQAASICLARGGSFVATRLPGNQTEAGLVLEYESKYGPKLRAVSAKFDAEVSAKLFEPHITGAFALIDAVLHK